MFISAYPFQTYLKLWKIQRERPEHAGESATRFYSFRIFTALSCMFLYLVFQLGTPMLVILADRTWSGLSSTIIGALMLFLIASGFFLGFYASKAADFVILKFELRNNSSTPSA
jgi:hypothetical protein